MRLRASLTPLAALALIAGTPARASDAPPLVTTPSGKLRGALTADGSIEVYKGIPFAAPPVGALRWKVPAPARKWRGVRDANEFSPDCMQAAAPGRRVSEDCLYLNLWVPNARKNGEKLPVFVWIYGGSFTRGGASQPVFDGARLAARGAIIVTFNYRLGALGFLAHPDLTREAGGSGNYGIWDQIAALRWIRTHIAAFGGNPERVTIAGESAGAISVNALMTAPAARGLFAGAIVQSGPIWGMSPPTRSRADLETLGTRMMQRRGLASIDAMRELPAETLLTLTPEEVGPLGLPFGPIIDGVLLKRSPAEVFVRGEQAPVPMIVGDTADEFSSFIPAVMTPAQFVEEMRAEFGEDADRYIALFPYASSVDARRARVQSKVYPIHDGTVSQAELHARRYPTYLYRFEQVPPGPDAQRLGASHGADVAYTFDALNDPARGWTAEDRSVAQAIAGSWIAFTQSGDPNDAGLPRWPRFDPARPMVLRFGDPVEAMPLLDRERMRAARRPHDVRWVEGFSRR